LKSRGDNQALSELGGASLRACATLIARKTWPINDTGTRNVRRLDFMCFILTSHRYCGGSVYPESYPLDNEQRGQAQRHDQNDFDTYMASSLIVTINARVATKEPTPVPEEVGAGDQKLIVIVVKQFNGTAPHRLW
jgi:hypothetical protein